MKTTSLDSFGGGSTDITGGLAGIANAANLHEPKDEQLNREWVDQSLEYGLETHWFSKKGGGNHEFRWVSGGDLPGYVEEHGDEHLSVPASYSTFDEFETYLSVIDGTIDEYGYGINAQALEQALRTLTGGGRYSASQYHVIACGVHPWLLLGPEGVLLCTPVPIGRDESIVRTSSMETPSGCLQVEEENPTAIRGLERAATYLSGRTPDEAFTPLSDPGLDDEQTVTFEEYAGPPEDRYKPGHKFEVSELEESAFKIYRSHLAPLGEMVLDPREIPGGDGPETIAPPSAASVIEIDWEPDFNIGESTDYGIAVGYSFNWSVKQNSPENIGVVTTYHLDVRAGNGSELHRTNKRVASVPMSIVS